MKANGIANLTGDDKNESVTTSAPKPSMINVYVIIYALISNHLTHMHSSAGMTGKAKVLAAAIQPLAEVMALHAVCIYDTPNNQSLIIMMNICMCVTGTDESGK